MTEYMSELNVETWNHRAERTRHDDDERREVARRLRGDPCDTLIPYRTGIHFGMGCHEAANRFWDMCERIKSAGDYDIAYSTRSVLADLIEPSEPKAKCVAEVKIDGEQLEKLVHDAVVECTGVDRDALLALADEMKRMPQCELCPAEIVDCSAHPDGCSDALLDYYARRIREALGVSDGGRVRHDIVTHRAPVLAADGRPLHEGEHVYHVETGAELVVKELPKPGEYQAVVVFAPPASHLTSFDPDQLTHERPDSWERLEEDAGKNPFDYCKDVGHRLDTCENSEAYKARDLVRRAKKLAGVE